MKNNTEKIELIKNLVIAGYQSEIIDTYSLAGKEHFVAYNGIDNEQGKHFAKGLKDVSNSNVNPEYKDINIKQQAGFSAEIKTVARENSQKIINGDNETKATRTDDMSMQSDGFGKTVGGKNEEYYDIALIDSDGNYIKGSARQLKFVGDDPVSCTNKLLTKKFNKYIDNEVPIEVPSDFYDGVKEELKNKSEKLTNNIKKAEEKGDVELANKHRARLKRIKKTGKLLKKGTLTNKEALEARNHPLISTLKDVNKISFQAGIEGVKVGALIGGGISTASNTLSVIEGEKAPEEAVKSIVKDTTIASVRSGTNNYVSTAIKSNLKNSPNIIGREISKSNIPNHIVDSALVLGKTVYKFSKGEIDEKQCFNILCQKTKEILLDELGNHVCDSLGMSNPVLYAMIVFYINCIIEDNKYNKLIKEKEKHISALKNKALTEMKNQRDYFKSIVESELGYWDETIQSGFDEILSSACEETYNFQGITNGLDKILSLFGEEVRFKTSEDFKKQLKKPFLTLEY